MSMSTAAGGDDGPIGFIGLGVMGLPMAQNLAEKYDRPLVVWNRTVARAGLLKANNLSVVSTPADVVKECSVTFSMLSTPAAVREVVHDSEHAALRSMGPGKSFVDCSTLTVDDMVRTSSAITELGGTFLEAPVSGSKGPAEAGSLIFLCAGDKSLFHSVKVPLDIMGKKSVFLGEVGNGTRMKLIVNQVMGTTLAALAEGIALSEVLDISVTDLLDILDIGATGNPMFKLKGGKMKSDVKDYACNFPLEHALKDMKFARELGGQKGVDMPVSDAATELYDKAAQLGLERKDFSAVIEGVRAAALQSIQQK